MDKIGSSYIALPDLIICGVAIVLIYRLTTQPPNSLECRIIAVLCGCMLVAIIVAIIVGNLTEDGVRELAMVGFGLAFGLFKWNDARVESRLAPVTPPDSQSKSL